MGSIAIVGLGERSVAALPDTARRRLSAADEVVVTSDSPEVLEMLASLGVETTTLAQAGLGKDASTSQIAATLATMSKDSDVVLAVAGFPLFRPGLVSGVLDRVSQPVDVLAGPSPLAALILAFDVDMTADLDIVDAGSLRAAETTRDGHLVVTGVRNAILARKAMEAMMEIFPAEHPLVVAGCVGDEGYDLRMATVGTLPQVEGLCETTSVYVPPTPFEAPGDFTDLVRIIATLRGPDGCPWDREQTSMTLRKNIIEEAYEVLSAIEAGGGEPLAEELGDLMLQIVLQAQIASEAGEYDIGDVTAGICDKLRRRHPHVFAGATAGDASEVMANWEAIKRDEKADSSTLDGVPDGLPSLARAQKISRRAAGIGFDWETVEDVWVKVAEEIDELKAAKRGTPEVADEVGDVLFTVVNVARKLGVDSEVALRDACDKFTRRFRSMERLADESGSRLSEMETADMERLWQDSKKEERADGAQG